MCLFFFLLVEAATLKSALPQLTRLLQRPSSWHASNKQQKTREHGPSPAMMVQTGIHLQEPPVPATVRNRTHHMFQSGTTITTQAPCWTCCRYCHATVLIPFPSRRRAAQQAATQCSSTSMQNTKPQATRYSVPASCDCTSASKQAVR